jgi:hypothetical protein
MVSDILVCFAWVAAVINAAFDVKFATMGILDGAVDPTFTLDELEYIQMASTYTNNQSNIG